MDIVESTIGNQTMESANTETALTEPNKVNRLELVGQLVAAAEKVLGNREAAVDLIVQYENAVEEQAVAENSLNMIPGEKKIE